MFCGLTVGIEPPARQMPAGPEPVGRSRKTPGLKGSRPPRVCSLFSCLRKLRVSLDWGSIASGAKMQGSDHSNGEFGGFNSSSDEMQLFGVRDRGLTLEIKNWYRGLAFYKDVKLPRVEVGIAHDLARMYMDPTVDEKRLNTPKLAIWMQEKDPALASSGQTLNIDKSFLIDFVAKHPLKPGVGKKWAESTKEEIIGLAPAALKGLKEWIAREHSSRAGRQRKDLDEIHPVVQEGDLLVMFKEIQHLKATINAQNAALEEKDAALREKDAALREKDAALREKDAALREKDAALRNKDAGITLLKEELYSANDLATVVTPFKPGLAEREEFHQNESNPASGPLMESMDWTMICTHLPTD